MSRIGKMPVSIPAGVTVDVKGDNVVHVKGPKGELTQQMHKDMLISVEEGAVVVKRPSEDKMHKSLHGLTRTLIHNMVVGVTEGYQKVLEINGVGYRAQMQGTTLNMALGYSHPVDIVPPEGITISVEANTKITVKGSNKQKVGDVAALIRSKRKPEVYKGKGVKYEGEYIRRKAGKAGKK